MRAAANTLFGKSEDSPSLIWPYFPDGEAMWEKHKELEAKHNSQEHQEKLKAARLKHIEEMKQANQGN